jgi:hypothetical protein
MKKAQILVFLAMMYPAKSLLAQTAAAAPPSQAAATKPADVEASNEELKALVARDQAVRTATSLKQDPKETDADRRVIVHRMISAGELHTGLDYRNASLVMQHGSAPDDYLLAHVLAVIGAGKGDKTALWLSAATLDRYLQSIKQPQIYGTQYRRVFSSQWTQEPYNRTLLTDALREATGVKTLQEQIKETEELDKQTSGK